MAMSLRPSDWPDSMYLESGLVTGNPHHLTASTPDFSRIAFASVWMNHLPKDEECEVKIAGLAHLFHTGTLTFQHRYSADDGWTGELLRDP